MKYFNDSEFYNIKEMNGILLAQLDAFREVLSVPLIITSSNSPSQTHTPNSMHPKGFAVDCVVVPNKEVNTHYIWLLALCYFNAVGYYSDEYWHFDMRPLSPGQPKLFWYGLNQPENIEYFYSGSHGLNILIQGIKT